MNLVYNPLYSFVKYIIIKLNKQLSYTKRNVGKKVPIMKDQIHTVFKEIYLQDSNHKRKEGHAVFHVIFHSSTKKRSLLFKNANSTIPFFIGLPGFCNKQFLINEKEKTFAGNYEWETIDHAKNYAHSFAVSSMAKSSYPFPLTYQIIDKVSGEIIEKGTV